MSIDVVMITTAQRNELFDQSLRTLRENAAVRERLTITIVVNSPDRTVAWSNEQSTTSILTGPVGASAARNIGASSIPKYRRQKYVLFLDDDVFMVKGYDAKMLELASVATDCIISGYSHPFNHCTDARHTDNTVEPPIGVIYGIPLVISSVCMMMPWEIFDEIGPWDEPGGAGASEDYAICMRAKAKGYGFAVSDPQCVLHTGLTSSNGQPIIGADQVRENNAKLEAVHGIQGKVIYA